MKMKIFILLLIIAARTTAYASNHERGAGAEHVVHRANHAEHSDHSDHADAGAVDNNTVDAKNEHDVKHVDHEAHGETAEHVEHAEKPAQESGVAAPKVGFLNWVKDKLFGEFEKKWDNAMNLDMDNQFLRAHIAELELENAILLYQANSCTENVKAEQYKAQARHEGGVESARTVASLGVHESNFQNEPLKETFDKGSNAFAEEDYETSAKLFIRLLENTENKTYQKPEVYYFAGVSLYQLKNYKKAAEYLIKCKDLVTREPASSTDQISFAPRSMAWLALTYDKLGNKSESKKIVHYLIQKYPKSQEARRYSSHGD